MWGQYLNLAILRFIHKGVVNQSGVWSNGVMGKVCEMGIEVDRKRHSKHTILKKVNRSGRKYE